MSEMPMDFTKALERTPQGYLALSWVLYVGSAALAAATLGEFSGTLLFLGAIGVIVVASSRKADAAPTIYGSHLENISRVMWVPCGVAVSDFIYMDHIRLWRFYHLATLPDLVGLDRLQTDQRHDEAERSEGVLNLAVGVSVWTFPARRLCGWRVNFNQQRRTFCCIA